MPQKKKILIFDKLRMYFLPDISRNISNYLNKNSLSYNVLSYRILRFIYLSLHFSLITKPIKFSIFRKLHIDIRIVEAILFQIFINKALDKVSFSKFYNNTLHPAIQSLEMLRSQPLVVIITSLLEHPCRGRPPLAVHPTCHIHDTPTGLCYTRSRHIKLWRFPILKQ